MSAASDLLIIGGGPVGATLALAVRDAGLAVTLLEARAAGAPSQDPRALALSQGSRLILERLGVWQAVAAHATPILTIHVSQRGHLGRTVLRAAEEGLPALGYVLPYAALSNALDRALEAADGIHIEHGARATALEVAADACVGFEQAGHARSHAAPLVVMADGGRSLGELPGMRRHVRDYGHSALVAQVRSELPHRHVAYERFTAQGPVALLPAARDDEYALVWTAAHERAAELCGCDEADFLTQLHAHFGDRVGRFVAVSGRSAFPLRLATMRPVVAPHLVVIGNAAQTLHPVAGQGFNLGLRDAWELAGQLRQTPREQLGGSAMLARYRARRRLDTGGGILFTDFLVRLFSNDVAGLGHLRGGGLALTELLAPARHFIARKMSFGARG